jgi:chromosome partitioning protein
MTSSVPGLGWPEEPSEGPAEPEAGEPRVAQSREMNAPRLPAAEPVLEPFAGKVDFESAGSRLPGRYARRAARVGIGWPTEGAEGSGGGAGTDRAGAGRAEEDVPPNSGGEKADGGDAAASSGLGSKSADEIGGPAQPPPIRVRQALAAVSRETTVANAGAPRGSDDEGMPAGAGSRTGESEDLVSIPEASADTPIARAAQAAIVARSGGEAWPRPGACRVVTIANQKGGVGKTTTAVNLAASLAMHGSRVLVIDLDPQGNASTALDIDHHSGVPSVYDVLVEEQPLSSVVRPVAGYSHLYCAPAAIDLAGAEIELVPLVARESRLARALATYDATDLDYIFIDCPPSLGLLTVNALVAAPEVLIPIQCEYYALEGLEQLLRTVELVRSHLNPTLSVTTILLTMYDGRTRLASQVADEVRDHFGAVVLGSVIPRSVRVSEAPSYGQSVMTYDPGSSGAQAYLEAARELARRNAREPVD